MKANLTAGLAGLLFGLGLTLSQMVDPNKVLNFLDVLGHWDPSLAFVMLGALAITGPGFFWIRHKTQAPLCEAQYNWPTHQSLTVRLFLGAGLFGLGWGLLGLCPGPALAQLSLNPGPAGLFVVVMVVSMLFTHALLERR